MHTRDFINLDELNRFLAQIDPNSVPLSVNQIPDYDGGPITVAVEGLSIEELVGYTVAANQPAMEAAPAPDVEEAPEGMASFIMNSLKQLEVAFRQRDEAITDHEKTKADFNEQLKRARLRGYAEALCGVFYGSNVHLMATPQNVRDSVYRTARDQIALIDRIEAAYEARNG